MQCAHVWHLPGAARGSAQSFCTCGIEKVLEWTLLNSFIAYAGYICAAYSIDKKWMGRMRLQSIGFFMSFVLFICCGLAYHELIKPGVPVCAVCYEIMIGML